MKGIGNDFMEYTKYKHLEEETGQSSGLPQPPMERAYDLTLPLIGLLKPESLNVEPALLNLINARRSLRKYSEKPFTLQELTYLLWCTQGVKKTTPSATFRTVPSAGARHAFETYLLINHVEGLAKGLYRYLALEHKLVAVNGDVDITEKVVAACLGQGFIGFSAVTFIWMADTTRMAWRYGERGYRYMHLDAGHVCQNLYLAAESIGGGACAIAAFDDDALNELVGADGKETFAIYAASVGKK